MTETATDVTYTPEELAHALAIVEHDTAAKAAALAARKAAYLSAVRNVAGTPAWATVRDGVSTIVSEVEADGSLSFQVVLLREVMVRLDAMLLAASAA